jgi:hypothetical protein
MEKRWTVVQATPIQCIGKNWRKRKNYNSKFPTVLRKYKFAVSLVKPPRGSVGMARRRGSEKVRFPRRNPPSRSHRGKSRANFASRANKSSLPPHPAQGGPRLCTVCAAVDHRMLPLLVAVGAVEHRMLPSRAAAAATMWAVAVSGAPSRAAVATAAWRGALAAPCTGRRPLGQQRPSGSVIRPWIWMAMVTNSMARRNTLVSFLDRFGEHPCRPC